MIGGTGEYLDALTLKFIKVQDFSAPSIELDPLRLYFPNDLTHLILAAFAADDETGISAGKCPIKAGE